MNGKSIMFNKIKLYLELKNFWGIMYKFYTLGLSFLTTWFIGRFLGPEKLGEYSLIQSTFLLFTTLIIGGTDLLVSLEFSLKNYNGVNFTSSLYFRISVAIVSLIILLLTRLIPISFIPILFLFLCLNIFNYLETYYYSNGNIRRYLFIFTVVTIPFFLLKACILYNTFDIKYKFILDAIEIAIIFTIGFYLLRKSIDFKKVFTKRVSILEKKEFIQSLTPLLLNSIFLILYSRIDQFFIHKYFGNSSLGIYSSYLQFTSIITIPISAIAIQSFPELARLKNINNLEYENHAKDLTKKIIFYNILWIIILYIVGNNFYHLLYGKKYEFNLLDIIILSIGYVFNCTGMIAGQLSVINKSFWLPISRSIIGLIVSITSSLTLLPHYSIRGAVFGFLITSLITNLLAYSFFKSGRQIFKIQTNGIFK